MLQYDRAAAIVSGDATLGVELGSTRIKAVLTGPDHAPIASGGHQWENRMENGVWTYGLDEVWAGLKDCYGSLKDDVLEKYGVKLSSVGAIGISAMMHGYLAFDGGGSLLVPYRTWRNTMTEQAAKELSKLFGFNIPQRWSIAHLYQALLNKEPHVKSVRYMTTLAGYIHWQLTGQKVIGIGDASGMFPIDSAAGGYNREMIEKFDGLLRAENIEWSLSDVLPAVKSAGETSGELTVNGAGLLDPTGDLLPGIPLCPPEGDAGTGMAATNSVTPRTGNISAGTSIFAMAVLEKEPGAAHPEIDLVTTPSGKPVAMVHCNNCTSDIDAWVSLFGETLNMMGAPYDKAKLYDELFSAALDGEADCGGLLSFCFYSGEHNLGLEEGRPLFVRLPDARFTLANFMRMHLYSAVAALKMGMDVLIKRENVKLDRMTGHGGFFKTRGAGQRIMASALGVPVAVMDTAGEGGAWGIALLAAYMKALHPDAAQDTGAAVSLEDYLSEEVFARAATESVDPDPAGAEGFEAYMRRFSAALEIERAAVNLLSGG